MRNSDVQAIGGLGGDALAAGASAIKDMHEGIAGRPFRSLGPMAAPVRIIHDGVSGAVYTGVQGALRGISRAGAGLLALGSSNEDPALVSTPAGALALGVINGLYGNHLNDRGSPLAVSMGVRRRGVDVPAEPESLADAYPDATSRIAVFVHGLMCDESCWRLMPLHGDRRGRRTYGERLQDEFNFTPVEIRYNTGRHVSENGRSLAELIDRIFQAWPNRVDEVLLVGHSMGGLVARSACHYAEAEGHSWTAAVRHVFCLGTPHLGADLEKGLNALGHWLGRLPEMRGLARMINARSVGIKDLRFGSCVDEDWCDCDPDEFLHDRCTEVPFLPHAHYYFIGAQLAGPVGGAVGDLLVRIPSSSGRGNGRGRRIPFEIDNGLELDGLNHFDLLSHPAVYGQLREWIARPKRLAPPAAVG
ncbi:MAG: alpha/beta fold hydrolase [Solirubrobacterales bacterium]|nr:alpha/beta fold hydrolase [Solirubrobacterales bacterium]